MIAVPQIDCCVISQHSLHHQLGHAQEETLNKTSQRLVKLMKNGMDGVNCLSGKGEFARYQMLRR